MDVKSLFKSGKKTIKAFKIAPSAEGSQADSKGTEGTMESWDTATPVQPAPTVNIKVDVEEYKAETVTASAAPTVQWSVDTAPEPAAEEKIEKTSSYVPPSQRRAEASKAMPTLSEAVQSTSGGLKPSSLKPAVSAPSAAVAPPRLKLITAASKKAQEEEERKKEEERKRKEEEKQARKEALRAGMERTASIAEQAQTVSVSDEIKTAPLAEVYAKYVGRVKSGRKLGGAA
jgi:hypothetical protein